MALAEVVDRADAILGYWFGAIGDGLSADPDKASLWWQKSDETDAFIRLEFEADLEKAAKGEYQGWEGSARRRLALIVLFDQFPRNMYRNTSRSFALDGRALGLTLSGLERGLDRSLRPIERVFFYMPLMHAEDRGIQRESVQQFEALAKAVPADARPNFQSFLEFAVRHREIVERFGRYPHRNEILARTSTPEELSFLQEPGSSF